MSQVFRLQISLARNTNRITITPTSITVKLREGTSSDLLALVEPHIREFLAERFSEIGPTLRGVLVVHGGRWTPLFLHARTPKETKVWQLENEP
jgi:hypothetical protein